MIERWNVWKILFYASMSVVTLWLILKVAGIIHTPIWLEYGVPIGGFIVAFLSFYSDLSKSITNTSQVLSAEIRNVASTVTDARIEVATVKTKVEHLEKKVDHFERKFTFA